MLSLGLRARILSSCPERFQQAHRTVLATPFTTRQSGQSTRLPWHTRREQQRRPHQDQPPAGAADVTGATLLLQFDGGSRGNPGLSGAGARLLIQRDVEHPPSEVWRGWRFLGDQLTSNEAEYEALLMGMEKASQLGASGLQAKGDSQLVVKQLLQEWKCRAPGLQPLLKHALGLRKHFDRFEITHIGRDGNTAADQIANQAMDLETTGEEFHITDGRSSTFGMTDTDYETMISNPF